VYAHWRDTLISSLPLPFPQMADNLYLVHTTVRAGYGMSKRELFCRSRLATAVLLNRSHIRPMER